MKKLFAALAGLLALVCAAPGSAASLQVEPTAAALTAALKSASCGDELLVLPGTIKAWRAGQIARDCRVNPVVITAADPSNRPVFAAGQSSAAMTIDGWQGVAIRGVVCDVRGGGYVHIPCFLLNSGWAGIWLEENEVVGLSDPTPNLKGAVELEGIGYGVSATKGSGLIVRRNLFRDLPKGLVVVDSDNVAFEDNDLVGVTTDGFQFAGIVKGRFARNLVLKKALPDASTAHPDCGQGSKGSRPSFDIVIADNLCQGSAAGKGTQGIFSSDDPLNDRITVARNVMLNTGFRAISAQGQRVDILDNVAISQRAADYSGLYWTGVTGQVAGNTVNRVMSQPAGAVTNTTTPRATAADVEAAYARWLAKYRPAPTSLTAASR